jgi:membrane associated rhomboid family serine protease
LKAMDSFRDSAPRQPLVRAPAAVIWLILLIVGAHVARVYALPGSGAAWIYNYGFWPARYSHSYLVARGGNPGSLFDRALPFVSYIFLHANFTHLLINCVWLLAFGPIVARRFGALPFLVFFLICGIAGAAVHLALNWGSEAPVIGASAAVSGLMAAGFRMLPPLSAQDRSLAPILSPRILVWSVLWAAVNVIAGLTGLGTGGQVELVAWQAHLGGYAAGLLLAGPFDSLARRDEHAGLPT